MDKYKNFSVDDFLQDEFFRRWVNKPSWKEAALWERWLDENPCMLDIISEAKETILAFKHEPGQLPDDFFHKLKNRIDSTIYAESNTQKKFFFQAHWLKVAAVLVGMVVTGGLLLILVEDRDVLAYSSGYGQTKKIVLPDGSEVVLNANSSLQYKNDTKINSREVWLKGEGFFHVKPARSSKNVALKFIVHTKDLDVEVLGTQFIVNDNQVDKTAVLLTKGSVRLSVTKSNSKPLNMIANELVEYSTTTKQLSIQKVRPENYTAWVEHKYIFEKTTVEELAKELQRYYGKQFKIQDTAMRKKLLSGTLELQDEDVLIKTLSVLLGASVYKDGNDVIIRSQ